MSENQSNDAINSGVKVIGETLLPGMSLLLDGDIKSGTLHAVGGLAGRAILGPIGWIAFAGNSFSKSLTGKGLIDQFRSEDSSEGSSDASSGESN